MPEPARICGFCGDRDPRWHGRDSGGWTRHLGLDRCPSCTFAEPPPLTDQKRAAEDDPRGLGDGLGR